MNRFALLADPADDPSWRQLGQEFAYALLGATALPAAMGVALTWVDRPGLGLATTFGGSLPYGLARTFFLSRWQAPKSAIKAAGLASIVCMLPNFGTMLLLGNAQIDEEKQISGQAPILDRTLPMLPNARMDTALPSGSPLRWRPYTLRGLRQADGSLRLTDTATGKAFTLRTVAERYLDQTDLDACRKTRTIYRVEPAPN